MECFKSVLFSKSVVLLFLMNCIAGGVWAQDKDQVHGLSQARFEATKRSPSINGNEKDGSLGDAAITSNQYDMLRYHLDLRIDPSDESLIGSVKMKFSSEIENLQNFVFDLDTQLGVDRIVYHGGELVFNQMPGDSVVVQLPVALALGTVDSLLVEYSGNPVEPSLDRGLVYRNYSFGGSSGPNIANMSEPAYAKYWWPCKDRPDDKAYTSVSLTVPDDLLAVSNGTLVGEEIPEAGWKTFHWSEAYLMPTYLVSVAISNYVLISEECTTAGLGSEVPLRHWVIPPDYDNALVDFAPMCEMMDFCEQKFGPYPFLGEKYGHAEFFWSGAMEHTTVTSIGHGSLLGDGSRDWLIVHELGHQWFGDSLTPRTWADIWLNEGFATYTEALWREDQFGTDAYMAYLISDRSDGVWKVQGPVYDPVPVFPGRVIYGKGSWILHMLRRRMGDTDFFALLQEWSNGGGRPGGTVITQDFIDLAESYSGQNLENFFWPYLEEIEHPRIVFQHQSSEGDAGPNTRLEISLRQTQPRVFDNIFPVVVTTTAGQETISLHLSDRTVTAAFELSAAVVSVELDPDPSVLWTLASGSGETIGLTLAYPNPSSVNYMFLRYHLDESSPVAVRILNARGHEVAYENLGQISPEVGFNEYVWNLRDHSGARVASGVYWATMEINGSRSVLKITVIH